MEAHKEGLLVDQIFRMAQALNREQRLILARALVHDEDRAEITASAPVTSCGHSPYDPCHNCDGISPGEADIDKRHFLDSDTDWKHPMTMQEIADAGM